VIDRAKGLLMQRQGLSEQAAYEKLRKTAMDKGLRLAEVAQRDKPEKKEVRIGFIPLTDCASGGDGLGAGFDKKYGIKIIPTKEALGRRARQAGQWRAGHGACAVRPGLRRAPGRQRPQEGHGRADDLNHNGQAITLSKKLADKGAVDGASLAKLMAADKRDYTFAQTFPTGTHAMWLYYWLAPRASTR
jgi:nitrate/nitrite transport system substrate-binding protein